MKLLISGNRTMPRSVGIFNLPPITTCTPSPWCREHCFALRGQFTFPSVQESLKWRLRQSRGARFSEKMIGEIERRRTITHVRIHICGDFHSKQYVDHWGEIARAFRDILFRTNTRRQDLMSHMKKRFPDNVVVRESVDMTRKPTGLFPLSAIPGTVGAEGYFPCIDDCAKCGFYCWRHRVNVRSAKVR